MTTEAVAAPSPYEVAHQSWRLAADVARGLGEGWWSGTGTVLHRWGEWWRGMATQPLSATTLPTQMATHGYRFWNEVWRRDRPAWSTPNEVVLERPFAWLRDFSAGETTGAPVLLLPPQAGHASTIVDYTDRQSQVQTLRAAGLPRVFVGEWRSATSATRDVGVDHYLTFLQEAVRRIGEPVHLIGDCQGGWLAAIFAALFPHHVRTLTLAGAPIDFQAGEGAIKNWVNLLCGTMGMTPYRMLIAANAGVLPGRAILNGFSLINPEQDFERYAALFDHASEPDFVERHHLFESWYMHTQNLPGAFYLWLIENLFWRNRMVSGTLEALGRRVDLRAISMPLALLAGSRDHITPPAQVFGILPHIATPPEQVLELTADGGHLGLFMGHSALSHEWPRVAEFIQAQPAPAR